MDAIVLAVAHKVVTEMTCSELDSLYDLNSECKKILFDIKGVMNKKEYERAGYIYWRL